MVDSYIIMPNHIHLILNLLSVEQKMTIGEFVGAVKSVTANSWRKACTERGIVMGKIWQRGYYDHVLRCEEDYIEKRRYIEENPANGGWGTRIDAVSPEIYRCQSISCRATARVAPTRCGTEKKCAADCTKK